MKHAGSDESRIESRSPEPVGNSVVNPDPFWIRIQEHSGPEFGSVSEYKIYSITLDRDPNSMYLVTTTLIGKRHLHGITPGYIAPIPGVHFVTVYRKAAMFTPDLENSLTVRAARIFKEKFYALHGPHMRSYRCTPQSPRSRLRKTSKVTQTSMFRTNKKDLIFTRFEQNDFKILILSVKNYLHLF